MFKYSVRLFVCSLLFFISAIPSFSSVEKIDGLEFSLRRIHDVNYEKFIKKNYDFYELYLENVSLNTYSIPGYSVDLGISYTNIPSVRRSLSSRGAKKLAALNIAADAASLVLGGAIIRSATNTAVRSVRSIRKRSVNGSGVDSDLLSEEVTYILYPGDSRSIYFLVKKSEGFEPNTIRFICKDEEKNKNHIVINNSLLASELSVTAKLKNAHLVGEVHSGYEYYNFRMFDEYRFAGGALDMRNPAYYKIDNSLRYIASPGGY